MIIIDYYCSGPYFRRNSDAEFLGELKKGLAMLKKGKAKLYTLEELFNK